MRRSWLRENVVRTAGRTPVAAVATPLPRRPTSNEERHYIMRDGIQARMKPDKSCNDTAARLCQLHMEAGNSLLATASTHRGQHVTRHKGGLAQGAGNVDCYRFCYSSCWSSLGVGCRCSDACTAHVKYLQQLKKKYQAKNVCLTLNSAVTHG